MHFKQQTYNFIRATATLERFADARCCHTDRRHLDTILPGSNRLQIFAYAYLLKVLLSNSLPRQQLFDGDGAPSTCNQPTRSRHMR